MSIPIKKILLLICIISMGISILMISMIIDNYFFSAEEFINIKIESLEYNYSSKYNIEFLNDNHFTVGDSKDVPSIFEGAEKYGIITSNIMETERYFKSIILNIVSNKEGLILADVRGISEDGRVTEWLSVDKDKNNKVDFFHSEYKFFQYRVILVAEPKNKPPIVKNIAVKIEVE